jgi:splicing factor 3B subunit 2
MQRYGPPPSFPNLKIPGLNAPIPLGTKFGCHPGGWGKGPVDEFNKPLYGDVFGMMEKIPQPIEQAPVERVLWGEIEEVDVQVDEVEESEEENEEMANEIDMDGIPMSDDQEIQSGFETPSGLTSTVPSGLETPDFLELRKSRFDIALEAQTQVQHDRYHVLSDRQQKKDFLRDQGYDISAPTLDEARVSVFPCVEAELIEQESGYDVTLNPEQLENLTKAELRALHDKEASKEMATRKNYGQYEDMSDLVIEHTELQAKKRKIQEEKKKSKFKF